MMNYMCLSPSTAENYAITELLQSTKTKDFGLVKSCIATTWKYASRPKEISQRCAFIAHRTVCGIYRYHAPHPLASNTMSTEPRVAQMGKGQTQPCHAAA